jgi:hypothetical protein
MVDTESEDDFKLVCEAIREGKAVLWAGAGLSAYAGYPVGTAFARVLTDEMGEFQSTEPLILPDVAERYEVVKGRDALLDKISEVFGKEPTDIETHRKLSLIKRIPFIVTMNYDRLFEAAYGDGIISIVSEQELSKTKDQGWGDRKPLLYKLHGDVDHPDQLVITRTDYKRFERESFLWKRISTLPVEYPIIFVGYSLNDENTRSLLDNILERLGPREQPYIIITKKADTDDQKWYQKHNVIWIEKDAVEAVREITDYVTCYSFVDSHGDIARMASSAALLKERNLDIPLTVENGRIRTLSVRPVDPDIPLTSNGGLHISAPKGSLHFKKLDDILYGRTFDPVVICEPDCIIKMDAEANGVFLIDPDDPFFDYLLLIPDPDEEKEVDLQIGSEQNRIPNVSLKRFVSDTNGRVVFTTPWFDLTFNFTHATRSVNRTLKIHTLKDIEKGREIHTFFNAWIEGESILVIPSGKEKPWSIPSPTHNEQELCSMIRLWYRFFVDLSDIQKKCQVKLQIPDDGITEDDIRNIADAAALIRGWRRYSGELTLTLDIKNSNISQVLTKEPLYIRNSATPFIETFEIFKNQVPVPYFLDARGVVLSNLEEARAEVEKGADTIILRYDGSVGTIFQRSLPYPPHEGNEEMKTS